MPKSYLLRRNKTQSPPSLALQSGHVRTVQIPKFRNSSSADTSCRNDLAKRSNFHTRTTSNFRFRVSRSISSRAGRFSEAPEISVVRVDLLHRPAPMLRILSQFVLLRLGGLVIRGNAGVNGYSCLFHVVLLTPILRMNSFALNG